MQPYVLPELPYDYSALEPHCSARTLELHHGQHHAAYVDGANAAALQLAAAGVAGDDDLLGSLRSALTFHVSGHVLHSMLWCTMSPTGGGRPDGELMAAIRETFGTFETMQCQVSAAATSIRGSGWGALAWEPVAGALVVEMVHDHQGNIGNGSVPLLALDVWEHAYYLQYQNRRAEWVAAFWNLVDWENVGRRFASVRLLDLLL
jgi:Fe-Mn family superoxide dismutase